MTEISLENPVKACPTCNGHGHERVETAPGEWRWHTCGACLGNGTAWAVQLADEFKRGWNAALDAIDTKLKGTRR